MPWPEAEHAVDEALARRLLGRQHPDLAGLPLQLVDAGFDNFIFRLGADRAVRMPRREPAAALIEHEQRWLPHLPVGLNLEVPVPERLGLPGEGYPWHWSVVPWIDGEPADRRPPSDQAETARRLGEFLHRLHQVAPPGLPTNPFRTGPLETRADTFGERMERLQHEIDTGTVEARWTEALRAPGPEGPPRWLHGDVHPANLLVRGGAVVAVIDFGDTCSGDPACDVGAAFLTVAPEHRQTFWAAYGTREAERRAQGWTLLFALMLLEIGLSHRPTYADVAQRALGWIYEGS